MPNTTEPLQLPVDGPAGRVVATREAAVKIALAYALVSAVWIFASDWLVHQTITNQDAVTLVATLKGWLFVLVSAAILAVALDRYFREIRRSALLLEESEQRWQFAIEGAGHGVWDWNVEMGEVFYSGRLQRMLGYDRSEFGPGLDEWKSRVHPDDLADVVALVEQHLTGASPTYTSEHRLRCKDGSYKWVLDQGRVMKRSADGRAIRMLGTHTDITDRIRAEEAMREGEAQFRAMFELASIGMAQANPATGRLLRVNQCLCDITGYSADELLELRVSDMTHPDDRGRDWALFEAVVSGAIPSYHIEKRYTRKDGVVIWVRVNMNVIRDAAGQPVRTMATIEDITERRSSEERYRDLVEMAFDWIWEVDASGHYTYASAKVFDLLGFTPDEVLGKTPFDLMTEDEALRVGTLFSTIAESRSPFSALENINRRKDGRIVVLESSGLPIIGPNGEFLGYRGMDRDVTRRKAAESALVASEERFRTLVEHAPTGIFVGSEGRFAYINQSAARMFDPTGTVRLVGRPVIERFHADSRPALVHRMRLVDEEGRATPPGEQRCLRVDGSEFEAEVATVPFVYDGAPSALVFFNDITDRKRLEAQLRQAQKLEAIGHLAGGVAHDFNNILAAMMMHLGLLQLSPALDDETWRAVKDLESEAQRAATLTRQLLMFSRRSVLAVKTTDVNDVVANLLKMLTRLIGEHVSLRFDGTSALPVVEADAGMLEQVLMNLVVNARDAMPKGGRITISTSVDTRKSSAPAGDDAQEASFVCLSVSDTGCGMDAATMKRIFEPFFTTKEAGRGTGLGLATVHGIVGQHNGWVEVESALGQGSTFRVLLPVSTRTQETPEAAAPEAANLTGNETILVVEDEPQVRRLIARSLRALGYQVYEAMNGQDALVLWQMHGMHIDLLFTDMVMPEGMTGLELAEHLRALKPGLKTIISSGYSSEMVQSGAPTRPGLAYLPKPYEAKALAQAVRQCLDL